VPGLRVVCPPDVLRAVTDGVGAALADGGDGGAARAQLLSAAAVYLPRAGGMGAAGVAAGGHAAPPALADALAALSALDEVTGVTTALDAAAVGGD